ncbi:MAG: aminoglycoside 6-adenylyltransferase [Ginsengibacter sp.]
MDRDVKIKKTILDFAKEDDRVRAVILNGSRANPNLPADKYQDFDILFVVREFDTFLLNENWISFMGKPIIRQLPNEMLLGSDAGEKQASYAYLMIFEDGTRIDLTLFPYEKFRSDFAFDSLTFVWLDKDNLFKDIPNSSDSDYYIRKPDEREFIETCNEFWWTATYVAKGLVRQEIVYAKSMLENVVRPMLMKQIEWKIGYENDFSVSVGRSGKFVKQYLDAILYERVLTTYADANIENNWAALKSMMVIFKNLQMQTAENLKFKVNLNEARNSYEYISKMSGEK